MSMYLLREKLKLGKNSDPELILHKKIKRFNYMSL